MFLKRNSTWEVQIQMERASRIVSGETCSSFQEQFQKVAVLKNFRKFQGKNLFQRDLLKRSYDLPLEGMFSLNQFLQSNWLLTERPSKII